MSLAGKILAILNVIAAIAFVYFAAVDYGKRQAWAQSAFRHELQITGLPVDDKTVDVDGVPVVDNLAATVLQQLFSGAGQPVKTQREELTRVQNRLKDNADAPKLARVLLPLANSAAHREELIWVATNDPRAPKHLDANTLTAELDALFAAATPTGDKPLSAEGQLGQRARIAELLVPLSPFMDGEVPADVNADPLESSGYRRVLTVVGLEQAARAVKSRAFALQQMTHDVAQSIEYDRSTYVAMQQKVLMELQTLLKELEAAKYTDAVQDSVVQKHQVVVDKRKNDVAQMEAELKDAISKTQAALKEQAAVEAALFKKQQEKKAAQDKNNALEKEIEKLEQGQK